MNDPEHEAEILWEILQDDANGDHHEIAAHYKDIKPLFYDNYKNSTSTSC